MNKRQGTLCNFRVKKSRIESVCTAINRDSTTSSLQSDLQDVQNDGEPTGTQKKKSAFIPTEVNVHEGPINCAVAGDACPMNEICEFFCQFSCIDTLVSELEVYGTSIYSINSSICKSALHDLRISKWNEDERHVIIKTFEKDDCSLESSVRFGFASYRLHNKFCRVFEFISPRISEEILDIASMHFNYLHYRGQMHTQVCFTASTDTRKTVKFGIYSGWTKDSGMRSEHIVINGNFVQNTKNWTETGKTADFGFQCIPDDSMLSIITSIAFRKDANFLPFSITVIANKNENVNLIMHETKQEYPYIHRQTVWRKDHFNLSYFGGMSRTELMLFNVSEASSGIYSLGYKASSDRFGFVQLIVRSCPERKFGPNCALDCQSCLNGGICHDITGECVCAPGFNGSRCEKACKPGYLGKMCSIACSTTRRKSCRGMLICLPKPYGCSCASGYTGLDCKKECQKGSYGAGCKQRHTRYEYPELDSCSKFNDSCDCLSGWYGINCNKSYPMLRNAPQLLNTSKNSILLSFNEWSNTSDIGSGTPVSYEVVYLGIGEESWRIIHIISAGVHNKTHVVNIQGLKPYTDYNIGVVVVDETGNKRDTSINLLHAYTLCDIPSSPPYNIKLYVRNQIIYVQWQPPPIANWNCWAIHTFFKMKMEGSSDMILVKIVDQYSNQHSFHSDPFMSWTIQVCVSPAAGTDNGMLCAEPKYIESDGPSFSNGVEIKIIKEATSLSFTWKLPWTFSHKLNHYVINYQDTDSGTSKSASVQSKDAICDGENKNNHCYTVNNLVAGHSYNFEIIAFNTYEEETVIRRFTVKLEDTSDPLVPILIVFVPLIFIIAIIIFILYMKKHGNWTSSAIVKFLPRKARNEFAASNKALDQMDKIETESLCDDISNRISITDFPQYVKEGIQNNKIRKEFMLVPNGQIYPCTIAKLEGNRHKNRYANILPYDYNRVILDIINEDPFSNYIHASYIHGYEQVKKYIAAQGPLLGTINDFWRMVWNEGSCKILMVTNFVEDWKPKCEKYWSDDTGTYGDVTVSLENTESYADFVIRTFRISKGEVSRELKQFHYITWPDHGTPSNLTPFINYLKKARNYLPDFGAAIIVHCSAGIGRTGATILLDSMIDIGLQENHVDLLNHLCSMRKQRMNVVENRDQYLFVHQALVEKLYFQDVYIKLSNFKQEFEKLQATDDTTGMTYIEKQFEALKNLTSELRHRDMKEAYLQENQSKNRSMMILPSDKARPFLPRNSTDSDYINAVYVDSYSTKNAFVATQYPLPATINDFWNMIYALNSKIIVLLQEVDISEKFTPQLWTSEGLQTFGNFQVECHSVTEENHFRLVNLTLSVNNSEATKLPLSVNFIILKSWPLSNNLPTDSTVILSAISKINALQCELDNHVITMVCLDGVTACGVFCAILYICDHIQREKEVSVFHAVKCIKPNRPQFIVDGDQYRFLYSLVHLYLECS